MPAAIDRAEVLRLRDEEDAQVVDVLPDREYTEAHIPGAANLPLRRLGAATVGVLDRSRPVIVYCHDAL